MNPKVILGLLMGAGVGALLPIGTPSATATVLSDRSELARQSSIGVDVVDLERRNSSEQLIAGNSSSNSSSDSSSNNSSNSSSNNSSNSSSNSNSNNSSNSNSNNSSNSNSNNSSNSNSNSSSDSGRRGDYWRYWLFNPRL